MSWRIVEITKRAKLDLRMNYLVVRQEDVTKIHLSEISMLIIEDTSVSLTAALISELNKQKIKVVFCDEKRSPESEIVPLYGSHDTSDKIRTQIKWNDEIKTAVWTEIVAEKIRKQAELLQITGHAEYEMLNNYISEIEFGDTSNREGHAAKVYFNALFGKSFTRSDDSEINKCLNYGYAILLSAFNREIVAAGYLTQLGLFHNNMFNHFNFSSDLMEPFRPVVDKCVFEMEPTLFKTDQKVQLINVLNKEIIFDDKKNTLINTIRMYCKSVFDALENNDPSYLRFYRNEL